MKLMRVWSPRLGEWTTQPDSSKVTPWFVVYSESSIDADDMRESSEQSPADLLPTTPGEHPFDDPWGLNGPIPGR